MRWVPLSLLLAAALTTTCAGCSGSKAPEGDRADAAGQPTALGSRSVTPSPTPDDSAAVAAALKALPANPAAAVASQSRALVRDPSEAFPRGTTIAPVAGSWAPDGTGIGGTQTITVHYPGRAPVTYVAVMVKEAGAWKVLATVPVTS